MKLSGPLGILTIISIVLIIPLNSQRIHCPMEKPFPCHPYMSCCGFHEYCSSKSSACEPCISFSVTKREEALKKCLKNEWKWESGQCRFACHFHFEKEMRGCDVKNVSTPEQTGRSTITPEQTVIGNAASTNKSSSDEQSHNVTIYVFLCVVIVGLLSYIGWTKAKSWYKNQDTKLKSILTDVSTSSSVAQIGQSNGSMGINRRSGDEVQQPNTAPTMAPDRDVPVHQAREEESPLLNRADDARDSPGHEGTNADIVAAEQACLRGMHLNETNFDESEVVTSVSRHQNSNV
ncbi:hypothetical protein Bpfe_024384 [Biomphalaria pfeifferi]|uniref:THAP-type domain-containing protein n=1 Tax=Biomphalaria pfeifferi TaxID=112525 RepID=A0AAD8B1C5_BIOPF|nr:hypothetical protein Bpfe_024384 [Biomphalaria pfeifferi]